MAIFSLQTKFYLLKVYLYFIKQVKMLKFFLFFSPEKNWFHILQTIEMLTAEGKKKKPENTKNEINCAIKIFISIVLIKIKNMTDCFIYKRTKRKTRKKKKRQIIIIYTLSIRRYKLHCISKTFTLKLAHSTVFVSICNQVFKFTWLKSVKHTEKAKKLKYIIVFTIHS